MESLMNFAKENYDLISLAIGILGVLVAIVALVYELKAKKNKGKKKGK